MFRFGVCCSKFLLLVAAISVLSYSFDSSALSSMPSDAFNGDLLVGELPYSVDSSGIITLELKKNAGSAKVELVILEEHAISFIAIKPMGCSAFESKECISVGFSYVEGCSKIFQWSNELFHMEKGWAKPVDDEAAISIKNGRTTKKSLRNKKDDHEEYLICATDFKKNDKSDQRGYLANFTLSGNVDCDVSVHFPPEYKILQPLVSQASGAPSKALSLWHIVAISISGVIVAGLLIVVLFYICLKYVCRPKPVLPTTSAANPSAPMAVTCLPDVKVVKPTATTQPPPNFSDLKQGSKPAPIPPPVSKDLKPGQEAASIPPPPVLVVEKDLPAVPSDKLLAIDDGDEVRLAPNTIEITSLEKKRRKNRRMLKAVDDDEKPDALESRSLALRNKSVARRQKDRCKHPYTLFVILFYCALFGTHIYCKAKVNQ